MMKKIEDKKKKQDLGIFYSPQEVVSFIFDILKIWKKKEDIELSRWESRKPNPHFPSVIDPACGEGVFLKTAVTSGFTGYHPKENTPYVFGIDIDGDVVNRWEEISLLHDVFKSNREKMMEHFHQQNGLIELPDKVFTYKTGGLKQFDTVVGNPPYGGIGVNFQGCLSKENQILLNSLEKYEIFSFRNNKSKPKDMIGSFGLFTENDAISKKKYLIKNDLIKEIQGLPIETMFIERSIQLAKPGGWIAIIIPDGLLSNSKSHFVRELIANKCKVKAIISLPRDTFKDTGTNAKTSILFLRKLRKEETIDNKHKVFLASIEKISTENFQFILDSFNDFVLSGEYHG